MGSTPGSLPEGQSLATQTLKAHQLELAGRGAGDAENRTMPSLHRLSIQELNTAPQSFPTRPNPNWVEAIPHRLIVARVRFPPYISQKEVCHLWNLLAKDTREGDVYIQLLKKLETARETLGDKVFDVLGQLFSGRSLRELLMDAVRYNERPEVEAQLELEIEGAVLGQRAVLVDERDLGTEPRLLFCLEHGLQDGRKTRSGQQQLISNSACSSAGQSSSAGS